MTMPPPSAVCTVVPRLVATVVIAELVANSCEPLIASVLLALMRPAATLVTVRSTPDAPTLTVLAGVVAANLYVVPAITALAVPTAAAVVEPEPSATSLALLATALGPIATLFVPVAAESGKVELALKYFVFPEAEFSAASALPTSLYVVAPIL